MYSSASIVRGSEWFGLRGRGVSIDVEQLKYLPRGTILHWEFSHFVVFDRMTRDGAVLERVAGVKEIAVRKSPEGGTVHEALAPPVARVELRGLAGQVEIYPI